MWRGWRASRVPLHTEARLLYRFSLVRLRKSDSSLA
jgi:hypothetical protein